MRKPTPSDIMDWSVTLAVSILGIGGATWLVCRMFGQL